MPIQPAVTVAIASYNASAYIEAAIRSAQAQTVHEIEILVVDDASSDDSPARVRAMALDDPRIRLDVLPANRGPGGARNRAIELARGRWYAVLDADDLMHPERLERLLAMATADNADMAADNLLLFDPTDPSVNTGFLTPERARERTWIDLPAYLDETLLLQSKANLGYLKPLIRMDRLRDTGILYDETLRIGEDDDLILRLLAAGLRYRLSPDLTYFYRRHSSSISHRLNDQHVARMASQEDRFRQALIHRGARIPKALDRRRLAVRRAGAFVHLVDRLKARDIAGAVRAVAETPSSALLLHMPISAALGRIGARLGLKRKTVAPPPLDGRNIALISRQRLVGRTNGSSTYLLDMVEALSDAGWRVHLIQPSPVVLGRWPVLKFKPAMRRFASISIRGVVRVGDLAIATDPRIYLAAARAVAAQLLNAARLPSAWLGAKPAPYAVAAPYVPEDNLYLARHAPASADRIILDYMFQTEALPYVLRPGVKSAIVMHDLFHARSEGFSRQNAADSVATITAADETRLLGRADAVIAIQAAEQAWVRTALPASTVIVTPQPAHPVAEAQVGEDDLALFVGSNTAPNVIGLNWFFQTCWPTVLAARPSAKLLVAGSVGRAVSAVPAGVQVLGVVDDLAALYTRAGVVISPLTTGSGLKIKLIEALAAGKATVATSVTLQGVEQAVTPVVRHADEARAFAAATAELMADRKARETLATLALAAARAHFGSEQCYAGLKAWLA